MMNIEEHEIYDALHRFFGYSSFRPGQYEMIHRVLGGKNVLGLLSTGGGKSLSYQLPALLLPGITVVVSPLISLMIDQVQQLRIRRKIPAAYINSALEANEWKRLKHEIEAGRYKLLYMSPEKLQQPHMLEWLARCGVSLVAVDEAHCISQWGHDFRTDYLRLPEVVKRLGSPPVLAVTATATGSVQQEICRLFSIRHEDVVAQSLNRSNIAFDVIRVDSELEKRELIIQALRSLKGPGIVYCRTRQAVDQFVATCSLEGIERIHGYHGGMTSMERVLIQEQFLRNELDVIVATNAFGMGIDKADIRYVLHYHYPASLEEYTQEVGRIGRDGEPGYAALYFLAEDFFLHQHLLQHEYPHEQEVERFVQLLQDWPREDISHSELVAMLGVGENISQLLFFHAEQAGAAVDVTTSRSGYRFRKQKPASPASLHEMIEKIQRAKQVKELKLRQMLDWLHQTGCLRDALNGYFEGDNEKRFDRYCCTNCGVNRQAYEENRPIGGTREKVWVLQEALRKLLPNEIMTGEERVRD